jgi:hypothetical protein
MSPDKKKIKKIYTQIDKLATKGREYAFEYSKYIDELVEKGDYNYLEMTLLYSYFIDITGFKTIEEVKKNTWNEILAQTNTSISKKIKRILDTNSVYQMGFSIYTNSNNYLGDIVEVETLSDDSKYYLHNRQFARIMGAKVTYLQVTKVGATSSVLINNVIENASEETNLVNRYKVAVDYLTS